MLTEEQLSRYVEGRLPEAERAVLETQLAGDPEGRGRLAEQQSMHLALLAVIGNGEENQRVKRSIFTVLRAAPEAQVAAHVMESARASRSHQPPPSSLQEWIHTWVAGLRGASWRAAAAAFSLIALVIISGLWWTRSRVPVPPVIGYVASVIGEPALLREKGAGSHLALNAEIRLGDQLETGDADSLEIRFNDGTTLQLHFNTAVEIPLPADRKAAARFTRPPEVELIQGRIWTVVQKSTNGTPYAIRTDAATALARGTEFGVKVDRPLQFQSTTTGTGGRTNATVLTVKEGTVEFFNAFGSVQATAMTESTARPGSAPTEPKRLQVLQARPSPSGESWSVQTAALKPMEAVRKLAGGGWFSGLQLRDAPHSSGPAGASREVRVAQVEEQSPADRAGIVPGDLLEAIDGDPVVSAAQAEQLLLARNSAVLQVRRQEIIEERTLTLSRTAPVLPGPHLTEDEQLKVSGLLEKWVRQSEASAVREQQRQAEAARSARSPTVRAAAFNNLGVLLELEDQLGAAVRAYRRAVYLSPGSALYRFNLGLALRKIGSYERAYEELLAALHLMPDSSLLQTRVAELEALLGAPAEALVRVEAGLENGPQSHNLWELKAQLLWRAGHLEDARVAAGQAVHLDPNCAVGHAYLGGVLRELGRLEEAEVAIQSALQIDPFHAGLHVELGLLRQNQGRPDAARRSFQRAIELQPDFAAAYRNLGSLLKDQADFSAAQQALERAVQLSPADVESHLELGWTALRSENSTRAEGAFWRALDLNPGNGEAYAGLGQIRSLQNQPVAAERLLRKAVELQPGRGQSWTLLGLVLRDLGRFDEALEAQRKAVQLSPEEPAGYVNLASLLLRLRNDVAESEKLANMALELAPKSAEALSTLGLVRANQRRFSEAEQLFRRAIALAPASSGYHNNLGGALRALGQTDDAEKSFREALRLDPENRSVYGNLAILYTIRRDFPQAEKMFREVLNRSKGTDRLPAMVNLAIVWGEQGKLTQAEDLFRQALAIAPDEPRILEPFAAFLADRDLKLDEALSFAQAAAHRMPADPDVLDTLGWVQLKRGNLSAAEHTLTKALQLAGDAPPAEKIREHLRVLGVRKQP